MSLARVEPSATIDDPTWTSGDFEVVTTDRVRFKIPSYHLYSAR
jgi:hypothetical protein